MGSSNTEERRDEPSVSYNELLVMQSLASGCRYGFEVMALSGLSAGTVYPMLKRFEASAYVESMKEGEAEAHAQGRPPRRLYGLTGKGTAILAQARRAFLSRHRALGLIGSEG